MAKRILLVDDGSTIRRAMRVLFERAGFECAEAEDGTKAVEQAVVYRPDLIVLDLAMPKMNGLQAAPILRKLLPDVPIMLFTLYAGSIVEAEAKAAGVTLVIQKDQAVSQLIDQANRLLQV